MEKLTIEQLIARKDHRRPETKLVHLDSLGGDLEIKKIDPMRYMDFSDRIEKAEGLGEAVSVNYELIYACCPILHNQQLQDAYECRDPLEIVPKLLDDNIAEMNQVVAEIATFYGLDLTNDVKN